MAVKQFMDDFSTLKSVPEKFETLATEEFKSDEVSLKKSTSISLNVFQAL